MKTRKLGVFAASSLIALYVRAADRTWTGGGGDAKWSTPANWGGTAPVANDTLVFDGTAKLANTNDLADDLPLAGIIFSSGAGAFTLSGKRITLGGSVTNLSANAQTITLPAILPDTSVFNSSNGALTVNGALSGAGGLTKAGPKALTLASSNSYDGVTTVNDGLLSVTHGNALGSTNGNTEINGPSGGCLEISGSIVVPEALSLNKQRPVGKNILYIPSGSNTLSGLVTFDASRLHLGGGTALILTGGVTNKGGYIVLNNPSGSTLAFYGKPISSAGNRFYLEGTGLTIMGVSGSIWTPTEIASTATLRTDVANALPPASPLRFNATSGKLDLNGFDQTVSELFHLSTGIIASAAPATLTVNQSTTSTYAGQLAGAVNLLKAGTGTLVLSNSLSATTGNITVTNGTLAVAIDNSLGNSTNVTVLGGTLELRTQYGIADTARLSISDGGAKVKIGAGLSETVDTLFLNGVPQASGTWGTSASGATHTDDSHFTGNGMLFVLSSPPVTAVNATWDAGGADTFISTTNNWSGDALPAFDGTTHAIFGDNGSTATVDTGVSLHGMTFSRAGDFTLAGGNGSVTLGAGGITAASPDTASRAYAVTEDLTLAENSLWNIATNGTGVTYLTVSGSIGDGPDPYRITKTGSGTLILSGSNTYDGVTTVSDGALYVTHPNALGSTNGLTEVNCMAGGHLNLRGGITVAEPFLVNGQRPGSKWSIYNDSGSNTLSGPVMRKLGGVGFRVHMAYATTLIFRGGLTGIGGGGWHIFNNNGGFLAFYDKPMVIAPSDVVYFELLGQTLLGVSGNVWGQTSINASGTLKMGAVNALPTASTLWIQNSNAVLDLNGFDQSVLSITEPSTGVITSAVPATLTVNQSAAATYRGLLTGAVSLFKTGAGTLTLSNSLSNTKGNITVTNGTLAVALDNSLGNSTNITAAGAAARLELRTSSGIIDTATVRIANDGAKVNLAAGVNERVGWLFIGGDMQRAGTYSATGGGGVQMIDTAHFSGTGILTVLHDNSGTLIKVR